MKHLLGLALVAGMAAGPVSAAVVDVVVTGRVADNVGNFFDDLNLFGGTLIGGAAFTANYTYDTSVGSRSNMVNNVPGDSLFGGQTVFEDIPIQGSITISGITYTVESDPSLPEIRDIGNAAIASNLNPGSFNAFGLAGYEVLAEAYSADFQQSAFGRLILQLYAPAGVLVGNLEADYAFNLDPIDLGNVVIPYLVGSFSVSKFDQNTNTGASTFATLFGESITVTCRDCSPVVDPGPSPVPLPASALLLLAAMGGLGALRLRKRAA